MNSSLITRLALLASVGWSLGGCTVQIPAGLLPIDKLPIEKPPVVEQPIHRLPYQRPPVSEEPDMAHELVQDFESSNGKDLALWEGVQALIHHREPGLDGSAGALEAVLYPGASSAHLDLRDALPATELASRTLRYSTLVSQEGAETPALEVQFSEDGGETWMTADHLADAVSTVSNEPIPVQARSVMCMPLPLDEVRHEEVSLPTGKIMVRFVISGKRGEAGNIVIDDLQIIARSNAVKPEPGAIPGSDEGGVPYPEPVPCVLPAAEF